MENAEFEFTHNFIGTDSWVEDIAANHNYYFVAEGCVNETKRMSIYDPTSKKLIKAIEMSNDTAPKRWDTKLILSSGYAMLDIKFREEATGQERFNMTTLYDISGPPSEWSDEGKAVAANTLAVVVKNDTFAYIAKRRSDTTIWLDLWQLEPTNETKATKMLSIKYVQASWSLGHVASQNELLFVGYVPETDRILVYFRDGETLATVSNRTKILTLVGKNQTGPIKSILKLNETHQLLHLYPVEEAESEHKNQLWLLDTDAQVLTNINIDDYAIGANTTFKLSSYDFNHQKYWFILPETDAELEFPKKPVYVTKDFQKKYEFDIGEDRQTRAIFNVKNKFVVAQAKFYTHTYVWQMSDDYTYHVKLAIEKELE